MFFSRSCDTFFLSKSINYLNQCCSRFVIQDIDLISAFVSIIFLFLNGGRKKKTIDVNADSKKIFHF